jgi:hypothetical protein
MISTKYKFSFTPAERARLMTDISRDDISAVAFIADVEACLQAFDYAASGSPDSVLPQNVDSDLATIVSAAAQLRSLLYRLPEDMALLIDMHLLAEGARRRVSADLSHLIEPLEDIAGAIAEIRRSARTDAAADMRLENRLIRALAMTYRNRLNRKATWHADSGFPVVLGAILAFAGDRLPSIATMRAALTTEHLRELLHESLEPGQPLAA